MRFNDKNYISRKIVSYTKTNANNLYFRSIYAICWKLAQSANIEKRAIKTGSLNNENEKYDAKNKFLGSLFILTQHIVL